MKKVFVFFLLVVLATGSSGQQTETTRRPFDKLRAQDKPLTRADYLKKSKGQKTAAWKGLEKLPH